MSIANNQLERMETNPRLSLHHKSTKFKSPHYDCLFSNSQLLNEFQNDLIRRNHL